MRNKVIRRRWRWRWRWRWKWRWRWRRRKANTVVHMSDVKMLNYFTRLIQELT
jgi:hypothetical protein